jgi:TnpA family transposase
MNKNFSQQSLIDRGTLNSEDLTEVKKCRGKQNQLGFAYQLIFIRLLNTPPNQVPFEIIEEIIVYAAIQLFMDSTEIEQYKNNRKKIYDHQQRIIKYLKCTEFDKAAQNKLNLFIIKQSLQFESVGLLQIKATEFLRESRILLPASDTLMRIVKKQRAAVRKNIFDKIHERLSATIIKNLDELLIVRNANYSGIEQIKRPIANISVDAILDVMQRLENIVQTGAMGIDLSDINNNYKRTLANEIKRCSANRIGQMEPTRRYTAILSFLQQVYQTYVDILISNYIKLVNIAYNRSKNEVLKQYHENEGKIRESLENYEKMKDIIQDDTIPDEQLRKILLEKFSDEFTKDISKIRSFLKGKTRQTFHAFINKYGYFRKFTPKLFSILQLQNESTSCESSTLEALKLLTEINTDSKRKLPSDTPTSFISKELQKSVISSNGEIKRHAWESSLYLKIRDELKQGNINAPESKHYSSIKSFNISDLDWILIAGDFFKHSGFPQKSEEVKKYFTERLDKGYSNYFACESKNDYAKVVNGKWSIGVDTAETLSSTQKDELKRMKAWIAKKMRNIKLPELLVEVDNEIYFTEPIIPLIKGDNTTKAIFDVLVTLMAHGCNIGTYTMPKLIKGITYDQICRITDWQLTEDALRVSLSRIVNAISKLGITKYWEDGKSSSSDAHIKEFKQKVSQQTYQPNFGDFAIAFYTFVADNYAPFHCKPIECTEGEAPHTLDGHLYNDSDLEFDEHFTDTRAAATILFSAFGWFGKKYSPRIRGIQNHHIYMIDSERNYGNLAPLLQHREAHIKLEMIEKQWDEMAQFYASIGQGKVTAAVALRRLLSLSKKNEFFKANLFLGRILKTEHILQHMSDPEYRRRKHRGLLKGEEIHQLARDINYANRGKITARSDKGLIVSCNSLTIILAAIIYWQSKELNRLFNLDEFKQMGFDPNLMKHISPVNWDNIVLYGEYIINMEMIKR